jgi:hypothetical protein
MQKGGRIEWSVDMAKRSKPENAANAITSTELALFCRQVGTMLLAGVDVLRALRVAGEQTESRRLESVAQRIGRDMASGRVMAWSLSRFPDLFSPFFVHMVRQGEAEGVLGEVFTTMADYLEREQGPVPGHLRGPAGQGFDIDEAIAKLKPLIFWQMLTFGVIALGIGALIWAHRAEWLPASTMGADVALWVGGCLMLSALIFGRFRPPKVERCSFCGRAQPNPGALMKGHGVAICADCVRSNVEQMKSDARRQLEAGTEDPAATPHSSDLVVSDDRSFPTNGRSYPNDDGDEGAGKKRIQL